MNIVLMTIAKLMVKFLSLIGRGSVYPGNFVLKYNPNFLLYFRPPKKVIYVTGTNGKSTVTHTLAKLFADAGYKVGHNSKGSNLRAGITTCFIENSTILGKSKVDVMILEIDERYVKIVLEKVKATDIVITNISRDQPPRQGHFEFIFDEIKKGINPDAHLFLNGDDPLVSRFKIDHPGKITFFSLSKTEFSKKEADLLYHDNMDVVYCPVCGEKLKYDYIHYGGVGAFKCVNKHFSKVSSKYEAKLKEDYIIIDSEKIKMPNNFLYNIYNLTACFAVADDALIDRKKIVSSLNKLEFKRIEDFKYHKKTFSFLLSKNENSVSYNQSLDFILKEDKECTVVIGFERISRRYLVRDLSWLYDVDFESLKNPNVKNIVCTGRFSYDIATRLKLAGLESKICEDSNMLVDFIDNFKEKNIYCLFCFELEKKLKKDLGERL